MEICAIRIDERLIHGQVATLWQGVWSCNRIMVIDEASANDPLLKSVLKISCPTGVKLSVLTPERAAENLLIENKYGRDRIVIITRKPNDIVEIIKKGVEFSKPLVVGNMSHSANKTRIAKSISVTSEDVDAFKYLNSVGIHLISQMVPSEAPSDFMQLLAAASVI